MLISQANISWKEFIQLDQLQLGDIASERFGYQVRQCFSRVNLIVRNNSEYVADLEKKVVKLLSVIGIE